MNAPDRRTSYAQATRAYDGEHENALAEAILRAVIDASKVSDANVAVVRTAELTSALLSCLAIALVMSPAASRSPTAVRKTVDELAKRLRRRVAAAESDETMRDFLQRCFRSDDDVGGHA